MIRRVVLIIRNDPKVWVESTQIICLRMSMSPKERSGQHETQVLRTQTWDRGRCRGMIVLDGTMHLFQA